MRPPKSAPLSRPAGRTHGRPHERRLGRRGVLAVGAGVAAGAAAGCAPATPRGSGSDSPADDPDLALVEEVLAALGAAAGLVAATAAAHPRLATSLTVLGSLHERHREVLLAAVPSGEVASPQADPPAVAGRPARAMSAVRRSENALAATLVEASVQALDGPLARALAAAAAGTTQAVLTLPVTAGGAGA